MIGEISCYQMSLKCRANLSACPPSIARLARSSQKYPAQSVMIAMRVKACIACQTWSTKWKSAKNFLTLSILSEYFRWFDSGDVQSVRMALNILDVVEATPGKRHWIPTKERSIWLEAIKQYGRKLPENVVIRYSATMVDQAPPESWAHSSAVVKSIDAIGHECPAPTQQGKCGECRACWDKNVKTVSYHKH